MTNYRATDVFIDASAFLAILLKEPDGDRFADVIERASTRFTSPVALFETVTRLMSKKGLSRQLAEEQVLTAVQTSAIEIISVTSDIGLLARDAFERYGKGRGHPAQLNMGDCFAYACAKSLGVPLLYKGDDFSRTDLA